jgi:hypothetical protein
MRWGGSVGAAVGFAPVAAGLALPPAPPRGKLSAPGAALALALGVGVGLGLGLALGGGVTDGALGRTIGGGDAVTSRSAAASLYEESFVPEFHSARPNSPSRYCDAMSRGMSSAIRG